MAILTRGRAARLAGAGGPLAALLLGGCLREDIVQPVQESVAVHAMAVVGSTSFGVALSGIPLFGAGQPISGATVRLLRGASAVTLVQTGTTSSYCFDPGPDESGFGVVPSAAQCYATNLNEPIGAGETLGLEIEMTDGTVIRGATTTPALPEQVVPAGDEPVEVTFYIEGFANGFSIDHGMLEVRWHSLDDRPADVLLDPRRIFQGGSGLEPDDCDFYSGDRSGFRRSPASARVSTFCHGTTEDPVWDSAYVELRVVAYDESYVRYAAAFHEEGSGVVLEHAAAGLERVSGDALVTGVFGAAAPVSVPLTLHAVVVDRRESSGSDATAARDPATADP